MAKRRRPLKRARAPITKLAFEPHHRDLFRLANDEWTAPTEMTVRHGARSWTLTADFAMADGALVTLTTRLTRTTAGGVSITDQRLNINWTLRGKS